MLTGIDHLVVAVTDPDAAVERLAARLGLLPGGGGRHDALGTFNRLLWFGDTYLECIGVVDRDRAAQSWVGVPTLRALDGGGGLATWAIASDAIDGDVARLRAGGSELAEPVGGERIRSDGKVVRWRLAAGPRLGPDAPPFLIEHDPTGAEWSPDDRAARALGRARLIALELGVTDIPATTGRLLRALDLRFRPSLEGGGARDADIGPQRLRLRRRRSESGPPVSVHLSIARRRASSFDMLGCHWIVGP